MASMPIIVDAGRLHLFPFSPHRATYEPLHPLKFQNFAPYQDYMEAATATWCASAATSAAACSTRTTTTAWKSRRASKGAGRARHRTVERTSYKRGATDFSSQIARLRAARCDLVVLATVVRARPSPPCPRRARSAGTSTRSNPWSPPPAIRRRPTSLAAPRSRACTRVGRCRTLRTPSHRARTPARRLDRALSRALQGPNPTLGCDYLERAMTPRRLFVGTARGHRAALRSGPRSGFAHTLVSKAWRSPATTFLAAPALPCGFHWERPPDAGFASTQPQRAELRSPTMTIEIQRRRSARTSRFPRVSKPRPRSRLASLLPERHPDRGGFLPPSTGTGMRQLPGRAGFH